MADGNLEKKILDCDVQVTDDIAVNPNIKIIKNVEKRKGCAKGNCLITEGVDEFARDYCIAEGKCEYKGKSAQAGGVTNTYFCKLNEPRPVVKTYNSTA